MRHVLQSGLNHPLIRKVSMSNFSSFSPVLAQSQPVVSPGEASTTPAAVGTTAEGGTTGTGGAQAAPGMGLWIYVPLILMIVFMIWSSSRQQKKERQKRDEMLKALHRGDKVQTIGGVIGSIADISDDEIVLNVEQGRIRFAKSAIQQVVRSTNSKGDAVLEAKPEGKTANV